MIYAVMMKMETLFFVLFLVLPPPSQCWFVCEIHGVCLLGHSLHPSVDELLVLLLDPIPLFFSHGELQIKRNHLVLDLLYIYISIQSCSGRKEPV